MINYAEATVFYPTPKFSMDKLEGKPVMDTLLRGLEFLDEYWLSAGTLLGLERDNEFIPHDTDLDIAVLGHWDRSRLPADEFYPIRLCEFAGKHTQSAYMHRPTNIIFDVFHYWPVEGEDKLINVQSHGRIIHTRSLIEPLATKEYLGHEFMVPADIDGHLTEWYKDWRTPRPGAKTEWVKA